MAYQQVAIELARDGPCTPWGFRMTGGADIGAPLVVQKVTFGSPSEGELHKGDIILKVRDKDASRLSHQVATDLIVKAGSTLKLLVARSVGGQYSRGISVTGVTAGGTAPPMMNGPGSLFKPLPTTNFAAQRQRRSSAESYTSTASSDTEKDLIVNQPYRSTPLILPSAKSSKDIPVGSYLRHDPLTKNTGTPPGLRDPYMLTRVQEAILEAAQTSSGYSSPGRTPTPDIGFQDGSQVSIRQYNSPINMYSNQAIVEALAAQTVSTKNPQMEHAQVLETKKGQNIQQSPTYQLIHEEEWKRGKVEEFEALKEHVYNVFPHGTDDNLEIQQSGSFKSIMHDLKGMSDF
jgi:hypothetical protein